jgi:hypothetical protein
MIRFLALSLLSFALVACSGNPTQDNRDRLGTAQTVLAAAQTVVLNYRARPPCPGPALCRDAAVYGEMQKVDRLAVNANAIAYEAVKRDPAAASTRLLIDAAVNAINGYGAFTKEQGSK